MYFHQGVTTDRINSSMRWQIQRQRSRMTFCRSKIKSNLLNYSDMFSISTDGEIKSRETFDYEQKTEYMFGVSVRDNGEPSYVSWAQITITVEDVNDHAPRFLLDLYEGMVVEDDHNPQPQQVVELVCSTP